MIIASIRLRTRLSTPVLPCNVRSSPSLRIMACTAATWPCGRLLEAGFCCASTRDLAAIKQRRNARNQRLRQLRQIRQRALLDAPTLAIALAQQNRRRRFPVRNGVDEHGRQESLFAANRKRATWTQWLPRNITQSPLPTQLSSRRQ